MLPSSRAVLTVNRWAGENLHFLLPLLAVIAYGFVYNYTPWYVSLAVAAAAIGYFAMSVKSVTDRQKPVDDVVVDAKRKEATEKMEENLKDLIEEEERLEAESKRAARRRKEKKKNKDLAHMQRQKKAERRQQEEARRMAAAEAAAEAEAAEAEADSDAEGRPAPVEDSDSDSDDEDMEMQVRRLAATRLRNDKELARKLGTTADAVLGGGSSGGGRRRR